MSSLGIKIYEKATPVSIPVTADSGIPYFVGTAPVHTAAKPGKVNTPILCTSWDEAVEKLGYSDDWKKYTLCEAMYSHLRLYGQEPAIFCNVLDSKKMQENVSEKTADVKNHRIKLPFETLESSIKLTLEDGTELKADENFTLYYDGEDCVIELLDSEADKLKVTYAAVKPENVAVADIVEGVAKVDDCMTAVGKIPDIICAPGWSHDTRIAAVMATKADSIMGLFHGKCIIDCDCTGDGVTEYSDLADYKSRKNFVDLNQIVCWPMVTLGDYKFHLSTQLAGLMASVDTSHHGVPYASPSNNNLKADGCCLADGTEVNLNWPQIETITGDYGVVTAVNFINRGWTAKGNYTGCYPGNTDVKDMFIPISRMFDFVGNTCIRTFWGHLDKPMTRRLIDNIMDTCNIWLNGLVSQEYLLGARVEFLADENPLLDLMAGIIRIHIYITPPSPLQLCEFTLEYDTGYVQSALAG